MKFLGKIIIFIFLLLFSIGIYLSFIGLETKRFNDLIVKNINKINPKINSKINKVKIHLDLTSLSVKVKTKKPRIEFDGKQILLEEVRTAIPIIHFIKNNFLFNNIYILTKENSIKNTLELIREFENNPKIFLLNKLIKRGNIVIEANLNFNDSGNIIQDYVFNGKIKDGEIKLLNNQSLKNINFKFNVQHNKYKLKDIKLNINNLKLFSNNINVENKKSNFYVSGDFKNEEDEIKVSSLKNIFRNSIFSNIKNIKLISDNNFSFYLNNKFNIKNFSIKSEIELINLSYFSEQFKKSQVFENEDGRIDFVKHKIKVSFENEKILVNGKGGVSVNKITDNVNYNFISAKKVLTFNIEADIENLPIKINFLDYQKPKNQKATFKINGTHQTGNQTRIKNIILNHNDNYFKLDDLYLNKNFLIKKIKSLDLKFKNADDHTNYFLLKKNKKNYTISSTSFDATNLIERILTSDSSESSFDKIFENFNSRIDFKIEKLNVDESSFLKKFDGYMIFKNNDIYSFIVKSKFENNKIFNFTIKTDENNQKITTLFTGNAVPLVNKYKFIKGFSDGSLDFYSVKKDKKSLSTLKIYDFKLKELPALTKLLTLASLQGIADLLSGEGISFNEFEMKFSNEGTLMTIEEIYAIGPAISILMSGYVESKKLISLKGTLVPATTLNKVIGSIPLLGNILVGRKTGEGVFGVSFKIKGPPKNLKTTVNPIKTLTPRFITRTLEKVKKKN